MNLKYEKSKIKDGYGHVVGCDEVGRGCLAGPVVAAAVVLDLGCKIYDLRGIKDSKLLAEQQRKQIEPIIKQCALAWGIGVVERNIIDKINIHHASLLAMKRAVESIAVDGKQLIAVDGKFIIPNINNLEQEAIINGDAKILSVAAASIIAKVFRDNLMKKFDKQFPQYSFGQHKGYATLQHRNAIKKFGLTPLHRLTFCSQYL